VSTIDVTTMYLFRRTPDPEAADNMEAALLAARESVQEAKRTYRDPAEALARIHADTRATFPKSDFLKGWVGRTESHLVGARVWQYRPDGATLDPSTALEIRQAIKAMPDVRRDGFVRERAAAGDWQVMAAVGSAPMAFPIISDEAKAQAAEVFAEATWPSEYAELQQKRDALETMEHNRARAEIELAKITGQPRPDPLAGFFAKQGA
jgi:hypothetical protein